MAMRRPRVVSWLPAPKAGPASSMMGIDPAETGGETAPVLGQPIGFGQNLDARFRHAEPGGTRRHRRAGFDAGPAAG
jgi:hypothetical protein